MHGGELRTLTTYHEDVLARSGSTRGMISLPRRRQAFTLQPATRTAASPGLSKAGDFNPTRPRTTWQEDAFTYYETLPPVGFVMDFKASTVAACDFVVLVDGPDGKIPVEKDEKVDRLMAALIGPRGGTEELRRRAALLLEITGEAFFVGSPVEDEAEAVWWEFLSVAEILPPSGGAVGGRYRRDFGSGDKVELSENTYIARLWRSDAKFSALAHCGLRRCLDTCRELVLLSRMTEAIIASRLPMGLLLIPDTVDWNSTLTRTDETSGSETDVADQPDFLDDLIAHLSAPITDFGSASTLVPLVVRAHADDLEKIKVVDLARNLDQYAAGLRDEMYGRLAIGLDVPPEILDGKGGTNHWSAWNIDNEFLFKHVAPLGNLIADFLTYAYLRPMLVESEGLTIEQAADYYVTFDPSPLANNQDDDSKARDLWDHLLISDRAVVEKQGWDPDAVMPDEEERTRRLVEKMVLTKVVSLSDEGAKYLGLDPKWFAVADPRRMPPSPFGQGAEETLPGGGSIPAEGGPPGDTENPGLPDQPTAEDANPTTGDATPPTRQQARTGGIAEALLVRQLATAADRDWERALERAGGRILSASQNKPLYRGRFHGRPNAADIPSLVAPDDLAALKLTTVGLLAEAWDNYATVAREWVGAYLHGLGMSQERARSESAALTGRLVADLNRWGMTNFHGARVRDRSTGLRIPVAPIAEAVSGIHATRPLVAVG